MAKRVFKSDLSVKGINNLIKQLEDYQQSLIQKCETFVKRLAEEGITVAQENTGNFGKYIAFSVETEPDVYGCTAILLATDTGTIRSEWQTKDGIKTADVSPLLMAEFGSGLKAQNPFDVSGVGTGTFPGGSHGSDPNGWWYMDLDGVWHHSYGMSPKQPMYKATMAMQEKIIEIAMEVFGE